MEENLRQRVNNKIRERVSDHIPVEMVSGDSGDSAFGSKKYSNLPPSSTDRGE
jgi:hypothetical protein